ncbi:hypothetical protein LCGC14_1642130, partial [marine sediment metagenome]
MAGFNQNKKQKSLKEVRLDIAILRSHIFEGLSQEEIMVAEEWDEREYDGIFKKLYDQETAKIENRPMVEVYVDYIYNQG